MTITMEGIVGLRKQARELYDRRLKAIDIVENMIRELLTQNGENEVRKITAIRCIKETIKSFGDREFTLSDICLVIPDVKKRRIEKVLYKLKIDGEVITTVKKYGSRGAKYQVNQDGEDIKSDDK